MSFCAPWARNVHYLQGPISNSPLIIPKYTFLGKVRGNCASAATQTCWGWTVLWWIHAFAGTSHTCSCLNVSHLEVKDWNESKNDHRIFFGVAVVLSVAPICGFSKHNLCYLMYIIRAIILLVKFSTHASGRMQGIQRLPTDLSAPGYWVIVNQSKISLEIPLILL